MAKYLVLDAKTGAGGSTCAAYLYEKATVTQLGNTFGTNYTANILSSPRNGIAQFQGDLYAMAQDGIYKKDDPTVTTGNWTSQITFTTPQATYDTFSGLYPIAVNGTMSLVGVFGDNANTTDFRWVKYDGTSWTQSASATTAVSSMTNVTDVIVYQNKIVMMGINGATIGSFIYDPSVDSFTNITESPLIFAGNINNQNMLQFGGELYLFYFASSTICRVAQFNSGTTNWDNFSTIYTLTGGGTWRHGRMASFVDTSGTNPTAVLLSHFNDAANYTGLVAHSSTDMTTWNDITSDVLPLGLQPVNAAYSGRFPVSFASSNDMRFMALVDPNTSTGTTSIEILFAKDEADGTPLTSYAWNGLSTTMTQNGNGGNVYHSFPSGYPNHGERIFRPDQLDVKIVSASTAIGGETISFVAYGGGTGRSFELWYSTDGEPDLLQGTLSTPVTGGSASLSGNQVIDVDADGSTVYTVKWSSATDGIGTGARVMRIPRILPS